MNRVFNRLYQYSSASVFPLLHYNRISSSIPGTVFMISGVDITGSLIYLCLEGFFFGTEISVLCALTTTLAKKVQSFLGLLGIYSGIFVMYLQCPLKESRTAIIVLYVLCLLYVISVVDFATDLLESILEVSNNSICNIRLSLCRCTIASESK
jgi:hypothetical protein